MPNHGTPSNEFPGWYVQFQTDVLLQLPRPGEISEDVVLRWHNNRGAMKKMLRKVFVRSTPKNTKPKSLLVSLGTVYVPPTTIPFVARDKFVINKREDAPVKISYISEDFEEWFLGKTEAPFGGSTLRYSKLSRNLVDDPIIAELGGEEKAETTLTELFSFLEMQRNGESGPLLENGYSNIFYIKDVNDTLRAVFAGWYGDGWDLGADPSTDPLKWTAGFRFFSRNSR